MTTPPRELRNQCDGCAQGLELRGWSHYKDGLPWVRCTGYEYAPAPRADAVHGPFESMDDLIADLKAPAAPPAEPSATDDLAEQLRRATIVIYGKCDESVLSAHKLMQKAAALIERQAREIADLNRWVQELALRGDRLSDSLTQAEAEHDALRECVRQMLEAVEPLVDFTSAATQIKFAEVLNAARAKVKP